MDTENKRLVQNAVKLAGFDLIGKLPVLPDRPVRNSYAHLWKEIKNKFGMSYADCDDSQIDEILLLIETIKRTHVEEKQDV